MEIRGDFLFLEVEALDISGKSVTNNHTVQQAWLSSIPVHISLILYLLSNMSWDDIGLPEAIVNHRASITW